MIIYLNAKFWEEIQIICFDYYDEINMKLNKGIETEMYKNELI